MEETNFKLGDQVRVVKYGHLIWRNKLETIEFPLRFPIISEDENTLVLDMSPEMVGQVGIINTTSKTQGIDSYSLSGLKGKCAWYNNDQLELVYRPTYEK
jgi:hypothetical protein